MKEVLETLARLWAPIANAPLWARLLVAAALFVGVAEAGQSGFLGSSLFWVAARVVPWPPLLEPLRTITTTYTIRSSSDGSWGPLAFGGPCPVGSQVDLSFQRSADGWVAVAGWNAREGLYPIATAGVRSLPVEKNNVYSFRLDMNSSAGREYLIILGSSKPFDAKRSFDDVAARLRASPADARGGVPELEGVALGHVAAGNLASPDHRHLRPVLVILGRSFEVLPTTSIIIRELMARNEDDFRIRPGKVRDRGGGQITGRRIGATRGRPTSFVGEVQRAIRRAGGNPNRDPGAGKRGGRFNARAGALQRRPTRASA